MLRMEGRMGALPSIQSNVTKAGRPCDLHRSCKATQIEATDSTPFKL
jgi:hypothetical protein